MTGNYIGKAKGGKLLRLSLSWKAGTVEEIAIRGDFFAHPEEAFDEAERSLRGLPLEGLGASFSRQLAKRGATLYGLLPEDLDDAVKAITGQHERGA